jgi:hypothetical protein
MTPNVIKASDEVLDDQDLRGLRCGQNTDIREGNAESRGSTSMAPPNDSGSKPNTGKPTLEVKNRGEGRASEEYVIPDRSEAADVVNNFHNNKEREYVGGSPNRKSPRRLHKSEITATSGRSRISTKSRLSLQSEKTSVCSSYYLNPDPDYSEKVRQRQMPESRDPEASSPSPKPIDIYGTPSVIVSRNSSNRIASPTPSEVSEMTDEQRDLCMRAWFITP